MSGWFAVTFGIVGLCLLAIGGFGLHLLESFSGRTLEAYCRLRRNVNRYGQILDRQESAMDGCRYLFLGGVSLFLTSFTLAIANQNPGFFSAYGLSVVGAIYRLSSLALLGTFAILLIGLWLPRIVERFGAATVLFHTWPLWMSLSGIFSPLRTLGEFFESIGQRLQDQSEPEDLEEELEDEIRTLVAAGEREGLVGQGIRDMIQKVLNLDERHVAQIMTPRSKIDALDILLPEDEILQMVANCGRTRLPVYDGSLDKVIGILFVKDLFARLTLPVDQRPELRSILRDAWHIPDSRKINDLLNEFLHKRNHMAIVVDDYQNCIGVVTIEDALEEIVGDIADEHDDEEFAEFEVNHETGEVIAQGLTLVNELNRALSWELPESEEYDTIAGLMISHLGEIPKESQTLDVNGVCIEVLKCSTRKISRLRLTNNRMLSEANSENSLESGTP